MRHGDSGVCFVRRKLFAAAAAYLTGIYLTTCICIPFEILCVLGVFCVAAGVIRLHRRQSALFFVMLVMLFAGYVRAYTALMTHDCATQPGVKIEGMIVSKEKDLRVMLDDVRIDGHQRIHRPVLVTLMVEEDENGAPLETCEAHIGQCVCGTGRLFEQDAVRNPGGTDWRIQALCDGYDLSGYVLPGWTAEGEARFSLGEWFRRARCALSGRIGQLFGERAPLFQAILIGERASMKEADVQAMRLSGVAHLLTISGMHLTLISCAITWFLRRLPLGRRGSYCLQTLLLIGYTAMTGCAAGTVRACIMAMMKALAKTCGRAYDPLTALAAAALIMTLVKPVWALSASFQFSFFVVLGIHLLNRQVRAAMSKGVKGKPWLKPVTGTVAVSVCAQLSALPMQLLFYGYIPLLALPMNIVCGALMPFLMMGGWGAVMLSGLSAAAGRAAAHVVGYGAALVGHLSRLAAEQSWSIVRLPAPYAPTIFLVILLMLCASRQIHMRKGRKALCLLLAGALAVFYLPRFDPGTRYVQLDVGQGDGAVLRRGRQAVLVDVGPSDEYAALRYLRHEGLFVDTVILSHLDEDHAGALGVLLDTEIGIDRIVMPEKAGEEEASEAVRDAIAKARERGVVIEEAARGDVIGTDACDFEVHSPHDGLSGSNERSLVLYADFNGMRILTLGDLTSSSEMEKIPACDLLKTAHHGSCYATSARLIAASDPEVAIISVGRNSYGHPGDRVLEDLYRQGAQVYRTDQSGCITIGIKDGAYSVETFIK